MKVPEADFSQYIAQAMDDLAEKVARDMNNVVIVWEDEPNDTQRTKMKLHADQTLFGLYEGIPLPQRGAGYNLVLPDKITIFKGPITRAAATIDAVKQQVHNTVWHEIAHHFGLNHQQIDRLEQPSTSDTMNT